MQKIEVNVDCLIREHIVYAKKLAKKFFKERSLFEIEYEDYEAAAYLGLCSAAKRFDPTCGVDFKSFSYYRIVGSMSDSLRRGGYDYVNYSLQYESKENQKSGEKRKIKKVYTSRVKDLKSFAGKVNTSEELGLTVYCTKANGTEANPQLSYARQLDPEIIALKNNLKTYVRNILGRLSESEQQLIEQYYFQDKNFTQIRQAENQSSRSRISRIHTRALNKIKNEIINFQGVVDVNFANYYA